MQVPPLLAAAATQVASVMGSATGHEETTNRSLRQHAWVYLKVGMKRLLEQRGTQRDVAGACLLQSCCLAVLSA
jgi:hypothetical protein